MYKRLLCLFSFSLLLQGCNYPEAISTPTSQTTVGSTPTPTFDPTSPGGSPADPLAFCEPNEGISSAAMIGNGTYSFMLAGGDYDWFQLHVSGPLIVRIAFQHTTGDLDLELYDAQYNLLDQSISVNNEEVVSVSPTAPETYFARVLGYQGATGPYTLTISGVDPSIAPDGVACPEVSGASDQPLGDLAFVVDFEGTGPDIFDGAANMGLLPAFYNLWAIGVDMLVPPGGHSDPIAVYTIPGGDYFYNANAIFYVGPLDLSQVNTARLVFNLYYDTEDSYDGMQVVVTTDNGDSWHLLTPDQGYPRFASVFPGPAFAGFSETWQEIHVDLSLHRSPQTIVGFHFRSDSSINRPGVGLDDIALWINGPFSPPLVTEIEPIDLQLPLSDLQPMDPTWLLKSPRLLADSILNCREGNHAGFPVLAQLDRGSIAPIKAVNPERTWFFVLHPTLNLSCWVWHEGGVVEGMREGVLELPNQLPETEGGDGDDQDQLPPFCLHGGGVGAPECVPCFEGANPGTACTP